MMPLSGATRTNQRAVYFFCQKYYKPRYLQKHYSREFYGGVKTLFTVNTLFTINQYVTYAIRGKYTIHPQTLFTATRKIIRGLRISFFSTQITIWEERNRERENVYRNRFDRN
jgi:hypothetical protein